MNEREARDILDSPAWRHKNVRRAELIRKKNREGLTPQEALEYAGLDRESGELLEAGFPAPPCPLCKGKSPDTCRVCGPDEGGLSSCSN